MKIDTENFALYNLSYKEIKTINDALLIIFREENKLAEIKISGIFERLKR